MESLLSFLGRSGYLPHGACIAWSPPLLWSFVTADLAIAAAYFSIPLAIGHYTRSPRPGRTGLGGLAVRCLHPGLRADAHLLDVWTLWNADYGLAGGRQGCVAAVLSLTTATVLWWLMPRLLGIPSVRQLQAAVQSLEAEVGHRRSAEDHAQPAGAGSGAHLGQHRCRLHRHRSRGARHADERGGRARDRLGTGRSARAAAARWCSSAPTRMRPRRTRRTRSTRGRSPSPRLVRSRLSGDTHAPPRCGPR